MSYENINLQILVLEFNSLQGMPISTDRCSIAKKKFDGIDGWNGADGFRWDGMAGIE